MEQNETSELRDTKTQSPDDSRELTLLSALQIELEKHGKTRPESVKECIALLMTEVPQPDAVEVLSRIIEDQQQIDEFSRPENSGEEPEAESLPNQTSSSAVPDSLRESNEPRNMQVAAASAAVVGLEDRSAQNEPAGFHGLLNVFHRPFTRASSIFITGLGVMAAIYTFVPPLYPVFVTLTSDPEIVYITSGRWSESKQKDLQDLLKDSIDEQKNLVPEIEESGDHVYHLENTNGKDFDVRVIDLEPKEKSNGLIEWDSIINRIDNSKTRCIVFESDSTTAVRFLDAIAGDALNIPIIFPGQTNHDLQGRRNDSNNMYFLAPDDKEQSQVLSKLAENLHRGKENRRIAVVWDYQNPIYSKPLADKVDIKSDQSNPAVYFGFGESQNEISSIFMGVESLEVIKGLKIATIVFASNNLPTTKRFLAFLDNIWNEEYKLNVIFTDGIANKNSKQLEFLRDYQNGNFSFYATNAKSSPVKSSEEDLFPKIVREVTVSNFDRDSIRTLLGDRVYSSAGSVDRHKPSEFFAFQLNSGAKKGADFWKPFPLETPTNITAK